MDEISKEMNVQIRRPEAVPALTILSPTPPPSTPTAPTYVSLSSPPRLQVCSTPDQGSPEQNSNLLPSMSATAGFASDRQENLKQSGN